MIWTKYKGELTIQFSIKLKKKLKYIYSEIKNILLYNFIVFIYKI